MCPVLYEAHLISGIVIFLLQLQRNADELETSIMKECLSHSFCVADLPACSCLSLPEWASSSFHPAFVKRNVWLTLAAAVAQYMQA